MPNLSKGLSNLSKKTSDEWMGVVFYLGIIFCSGIGCQLLSKPIQKKYLSDISLLKDDPIFEDFKDRMAIDNFGYMLECLSCYDAFNKKEEGYWDANNEVEHNEGEGTTLNSISKMLLMFCGNCPMIQKVLPNGDISAKGNGWKQPKFHSHLHLPNWISDLGSPANYNTQCFESNHKIIVKNVAKNVQKCGNGKFLSQIATRGYERQILTVAMEKLNIEPITTAYQFSNTTKDNDDICTSQDSWYTKKATNFTLTVHQNGNVIQKWQHSKSIALYLQIQPIVCSFISSQYRSNQKVTIISCVTELQLANKKTIRCHPNYQGEGEWSDWILEQCAFSVKKMVK